MGDLRLKVKNAKTVVIKVGTSTITYANGSINFSAIEKLVRVLADLKNQGRNVVLVTSGAIAAGVSRMGFKKRPDSVPEKQALAAIGQGNLMHIYSKLFAEYGQTAAQVLLTKDVLDGGTREKNACNTFITLFKYGSIPIVNENDTIATEEIEFGDNDTLSAIVASLVSADLLILLSDIDGLYDKDPKISKDAKLIFYVNEITSAIEEMSCGTLNGFGTGGMKTKIAAARICMTNNIPMVITNGEDPDNIRKASNGEEIGTLFMPYEREISFERSN